MAGTVMHLVIADRLLDRLHIVNPAMFYCGNLAPDAIMGRENYEREMKNHTHFKDGLKSYEFRIKTNQEAYLKRFMAFAEEFLDRNNPNYELYLGYVVHMLVDELYLLDYYEDFLIDLESKGISPEDEEFCKGFTGDVDRVDWELVRNYRFRYPMPETLLNFSGYDIPGWINEWEIEGSKRFIIYKNFECKHESEPLVVMSLKRNYEYIDLCVEKIPQMLMERFDISIHK